MGREGEMEELAKAFDLLKEEHKVSVQRVPTMLSFGTLEECRSLFQRAFLYSDKSVGEFKFLPEYERVVEWMSNNRGKGLLLMGNVGRGKTVISTGVIPGLFYYRLRKIVKSVAAEDMPIKVESIVKQPFLCIDDLGTEPLANNYGVKYEAFARLINEAEAKLKLVFISTNLTIDELIDRYGVRSVDRLIRLCKIIKFEGESLRK